MIKKLDKETINLISAGEIIESPADILKELLENSVDAKSTIITVTIKNSGLGLIEVKDNGLGISKNDLSLTIERYATSKLKKIDELYSLNTFGFRGEALSSISAVSKFKILSSDNNTGVGYLLEENQIKEQPSTKGTTVSVKDLFYNVPVRKKFLRSLNTEFSKLYSVFLESALLNPEIKYQIISDKKNETYPKTTKEGRFIQVFGKDIISKTITVDVSNSVFKLNGLLCKPTNYFYFPNNFLYINKRPVYSSQINKHISDSYKDYLMVQQKPFFVLFFEFDSNLLDINIHPKKRTIKIQNEFLFLTELKKELDSIFSKTNEEVTKQVPFFTESYTFNNPQEIKLTDYYKLETTEEKETDFRYQTFTAPSIKEIQLNEHKIKSVLGQIQNTFIVCEIEDGMLLIDQHAAEERINLDKNRINYVDYLKIQKLLTPKLIKNLNLETKEFILKNKNLFSDLGFNIDIRNNDYYLTTIPEFLERYFTVEIFFEILKNIEENPIDNINKIKDRILKLKSCKESIKANDPLSISQIYNLINRLNKSKDNTICAHGRPTFLVFKKKELEKMFKRII